MPTAIFYGTKTGIPRRVVVCDTSAEMAAHKPEAGEDVIRIAALPMVDGKPDANAVQMLIEERRGKPSETSRCVVIDDASDEIEQVVLADPSIDALPGKTIAQHPVADVGWKKNARGDYVEPTREELIDGKTAIVGGRTAMLDKAANTAKETLSLGTTT